ncbi:hypothetical protein Pyn_33593 [Prunus yedoensis var. nudiflora]|uniref:Uncharacterized protein n=1 Tax=Prunus yedoensis var. nudiflora TaxID=2094558 RepID=A0A314ZBH7_PRUYE|nr:hypothetical protein Pyn_33593 [Prunus yedoensis var. nudiflora]
MPSTQSSTDASNEIFQRCRPITYIPTISSSPFRFLMALNSHSLSQNHPSLQCAQPHTNSDSKLVFVLVTRWSTTPQPLLICCLYVRTMSFRSLYFTGVVSCFSMSDLFEEVEGFGLGFWTEDHMRKMIDEFEKVKQTIGSVWEFLDIRSQPLYHKC